MKNFVSYVEGTQVLAHQYFLMIMIWRWWMVGIIFLSMSRRHTSPMLLVAAISWSSRSHGNLATYWVVFDLPDLILLATGLLQMLVSNSSHLVNLQYPTVLLVSYCRTLTIVHNITYSLILKIYWEHCFKVIYFAFAYFIQLVGMQDDSQLRNIRDNIHFIIHFTSQVWRLLLVSR